MPGRPSHLPNYRERTAMQLLRDRGELQANELYPAGGATIVKLQAKGWIEAIGPDTYRLTPAGLAAMKAPIPPHTR